MKWKPSGTQRRLASLEKTDVSEVRTASIVALLMEAVRTFETSVYSNKSS
jgi:hypothetical protein